MMSFDISRSIHFSSYITQYDREIMCILYGPRNFTDFTNALQIIREKSGKFTVSVIICEVLQQNQISYNWVGGKSCFNCGRVHVVQSW